MTVVPRPHSSNLTGGSFGLTKRTGIEYDDLFSPDALRTACRLRDEIAERCAIRPAVVRRRGPRQGAILLGTLDEPVIAEALRAAGAPAKYRDLKREGYVLQIDREGVIIAGFDGDGLFRGVQTFLQLIERRGRSFHVPCGRHVDAPAHPFRGVHLYVPPKTEIAYFKRLIRYFAACGINTIVLEIAAAMEFKRHPELNRAWEAYCHTARKYPLVASSFIEIRTGVL